MIQISGKKGAKEGKKKEKKGGLGDYPPLLLMLGANNRDKTTGKNVCSFTAFIFPKLLCGTTKKFTVLFISHVSGYGAIGFTGGIVA